MNRIRCKYVLAFAVMLLGFSSSLGREPKGKLVAVGDGYAATSVNTAVFRGSALATHGDTQYIAYYDGDGYVTLGKRKLDSEDWTLHRTQYKGKVTDGHNIISIGVDGDGFLHASFDHHGHPLKYAKTVAPGSLELGELSPMTGTDEQDVTYPEFYTLANGNLIFAYRWGASGRGNLVLNRYDAKTKEWNRVHDVLIDGEGERNAYWQMFADPKGTLHLSWVWRETWLVETNHDLCYARSDDGGKTWKRSDGTLYELPITQATAEKAWEIPQNSELINQTSMTADAKGNPFIATYWRDKESDIPQYRLVWHDGTQWQMSTVVERKTAFSLSGGGTKMIPIARPRIVSDGRKACYIFRDEERGSKVSVAYTPQLG
ncbi:MAG: BNR repeat-containing protein [Muribaculaceae bacterium]|nr:BNR repeat-containing protein [Muribaculaceae bacterium]